ncbi:MAG: penicillin-binding protein activator, partial [Ghiorsea sp.]
MMKPAYTFSTTTAIFFALLVLSGCSGKQKESTIHIDEQRILRAESLALATKLDGDRQRIEQLQSQARLEHPLAFSRNQLLLMTQDQALPQQSQGLAALKYAELLLILQTEDALVVSHETLQIWQRHDYAPYVQLQLAKMWLAMDGYEEALAAVTQALHVAQEVRKPLLQEMIALVDPLLNVVSDELSIAWMLAVAKHDALQSDTWLQRAAKLAPLEFVLGLRQSDTPLVDKQAKFYQFAARERLMVGDYHAVRVISKILVHDMPDTTASETVLGWAESEGEQNVVGVLLPLSGKYAAYGQQMLKGIRLAMSRPEFEGSITLRIQDTAGDEQVCISGYFQLLTQGAQWVIGPLLSSHTAALKPYLVDDIPVIALSNQTQLAADSPSLFIHSLAKTVQADFMAHYAWQQGKKRMAIIYGHQTSERDEALAFAQTFMDAGGEIVDILQLKKGVYDHRPALLGLREDTDDEVLLAELDEELGLFSAENNMDIRLPINVDGIYIATSGKQLSVLAGQMAYLDMQRTQYYG